MWIIEQGHVQIERDIDNRNTAHVRGVLGPSDVRHCKQSCRGPLFSVLIKHALPQVFGELAVLVQEKPGMPLPRMRTAHACKASLTVAGESHATLLALSYDDVGPSLSRVVALRFIAIPIATYDSTRKPTGPTVSFHRRHDRHWLADTGPNDEDSN